MKREKGKMVNGKKVKGGAEVVWAIATCALVAVGIGFCFIFFGQSKDTYKTAQETTVDGTKVGDAVKDPKKYLNMDESSGTGN